MADEVHDDGGMDGSTAALIVIEPLAAHAPGVEKRTFLGIEDRDDEVALKFARGSDGFGRRKRDGDCGGIVISARGGDGAVVVGTYAGGGVNVG
jgi:hypothetical protein